MISTSSRIKYIGASDTHHVMGNWDTATFAKWWRQKQGIDTSSFHSIYTDTGTAFEHKIAEQIGMDDIDRQIYIDGINIRVNLDGTLDGEIIEIKTYKYRPNWKPSKDYRSQVQVEMWADKKKSAMVVAYALEEDDYEDWTRPVDAGRLSYYPFDYDVDFIIDYLPRVIYLSDCIDKGLFPRKDAYESQLDEYQRRAKDYYVND